MLVQRCRLEAHRIVVPINLARHEFHGGQLTIPGEAGALTSANGYRGVIDTGAQRSVVSQRVVEEQQLMRTGHMSFGSIHGVRSHSKHMATIGFWAERVFDLSSNEPGEQSYFGHPRPFECVMMEANENFDALIGFDILSSYNFRFDRDEQMFSLILSP